MKHCRHRFDIVVALFLALLAYSADCPAASAPNIAGCPLLPADNVWNTPADSLPVSPSSAAYITTIGAATGLHPDFGSGLWEGAPIGIPLTIVPGNQPKVGVTFDYSDESDPGPYPIPQDAAIEGGSESTGDRHVLVLDRDACRLYEVYSAYPNDDGTWRAGSGAVFDLRSNRLRPEGWTSADAAGLAILPGLVRYDEVEAGEIRHALRFTAPQTRKAYVWPGRHYASNLTGASYPPMGQRFRLKADFDISGFSPQVRVILRALKKYGMILSDNGSSWYISGMPDSRWNNDQLVSELGLVKGSAFEAVDGTAPMTGRDSGRAMAVLDPAPPGRTARLVFIHHSTGQNWLADDNGGLGTALRDSNYFVSDTNYGWGPDAIGDHTDIGDWWTWFRGPDAAAYLASLYGESGQHSSYSRLPTAPAGENQIVMFKSCFPNSALRGNPDDPVPAIDGNPLKGVGSGSEHHTVANAKGIYIDLLNYFKTRRDKLFVVITAPPLTDPAYGANARAFNRWLVNEWLADYPYRNVAVFDFYNVLTTNGGNANTNDLGLATGNHHRWLNGGIRHNTDGDNDANPNVLEYPTGDDHPSRAGNLKATGEFVTVLNALYRNHLHPAVAPCDFDGDGRSDITVWRPAQGSWFTITSATQGQSILNYGTTGDIPVPGDYDGDGRSDRAVFRPSNGTWYVMNGATNTQQVTAYGAADDIPVPGDYDGIGRTEMAVFRPSAGTWYIRNGVANTQSVVSYGTTGDIPVPGDYDGDGRTDMAVFRPSSGAWFTRYSATGLQSVVSFGTAGDVPVSGDYDGDGKSDIAVFRPSGGIWFVRNSATGGQSVFGFGTSGDIPVSGDYDGDGRTDLAVFRPSNSIWFVKDSSTGTQRAVGFGAAGDVPLPAAH
jgi:hypothetical protein